MLNHLMARLTRPSERKPVDTCRVYSRHKKIRSLTSIVGTMVSGVVSGLLGLEFFLSNKLWGRKGHSSFRTVLVHRVWGLGLAS